MREVNWLLEFLRRACTLLVAIVLIDLARGDIYGTTEGYALWYVGVALTVATFVPAKWLQR